MYLNIAVLKETQPDERRVALDPVVAARLIKSGAKVAVQSWAWDSSRLDGVAFKGILFTEDPEELLCDADIVLAVQPPVVDVIDAMQEGAILISFVHPHKDPVLVKRLLNKKITSFVLDRVPHVPQAQETKGSSNLFNIICLMVKNNVIEFDWHNEILAKSLFTHAGKIWNVPIEAQAELKNARKKSDERQDRNVAYLSAQDFNAESAGI